MAVVAAATSAYDFVISTGDNFYVHGVANVADPLFQSVYEGIYTHAALQVPWYPALGNHDCRGACFFNRKCAAVDGRGRSLTPRVRDAVALSVRGTSAGNVSAQIAYSDRSTRWTMHVAARTRLSARWRAFIPDRPASVATCGTGGGRRTRPDRYYQVRYTLDGGAELRVLVLDACTLVCHTPRLGKTDYETADCNGAEDSTARLAQLQWLDDELTAADEAAAAPGAGHVWRVLVAHWPLVSAGNHGDSPSLQASLLPFLARHRVHAVFAGHDHGLQHLYVPPELLAPAPIGGGADNDDGGAVVIPAAGGASAVPADALQVFVSGGGGYRLDKGFREHASAIATYLTHGFMTLEASAAALHVRFYNADTTTSTAFYEASVLPQA